jgi:hypothetical protein
MRLVRALPYAMGQVRCINQHFPTSFRILAQA